MNDIAIEKLIDELDAFKVRLDLHNDSARYEKDVRCVDFTLKNFYDYLKKGYIDD